MTRDAGPPRWAAALLLLAVALLGGCPPAEPTGRALFVRHCAYCHGVDGGGAGPFPPLQDPWLETPVLARIILDGVTGPIEVGDRVYNETMIGLGETLTDAEIAMIMDHVQETMSERPAEGVSARLVRRIRQETRDRRTAWRAEALRAYIASGDEEADGAAPSNRGP